MSFTERQKQIIDKLRPKPINHGQLETILIAVPNLKSENISPERWQLLKNSLIQEGSNLIPLIVRRTDAYEDEEYEIVYGEDWCLVAKELDIERLWVWVFDLNDEQAEATKAEMELLLSNSATVAPPPDEIKQISSLLQRLEQSLERKMSQQTEDLLQRLEKTFEQRISQQMDSLFQHLERSLEAKITQQISEAMNSAIVELKQTPIRQTSSRQKAATSNEGPYSNMTVKELKQLAKERQLNAPSRLLKQELVDLLTQADQPSVD